MLDSQCEYYLDLWKMQASMIMCILIHGYNIVRLFHKIYYNLRSNLTAKASLWKCLLLDCYCCLASLSHAFVISIFFLLESIDEKCE